MKQWWQTNKTLFVSIWIIAWACINVIVTHRFRKSPRQFVTQVMRKTSIKVLHVFKATYSIQYTCSLPKNEATPRIYMSNHQSFLDLLLLYATITDTVRPAGTHTLFKIPLFGRAITISESVPIDRTDPNMSMTQFFVMAKKRLQSGLAIWVFPEGIRATGNTMLPFKAGVFRLAREIGATIIPVAIMNTGYTLPPFQFKTIRFGQKLKMVVGEPIDTQNYQTIESQKELMSRVRTAITELME